LPPAARYDRTVSVSVEGVMKPTSFIVMRVRRLQERVEA
jgi:hypothetical protein